MHVGMNIEDKQQLFNEVFRLLKTNAYFGIYDVLRQKDGKLNYPLHYPLHYPLPWATQQKNSYLATLEQYKTYLVAAGFEVIVVNSRRDFALDFFAQTKQKNKSKSSTDSSKNNGLPVLGLHTLMRTSSHEKLTNLRTNIENYTIAPIEIIARKP